ncbi:uncharacterized protein TNCT_227181 [Trichonephila clavata]|uniref:Uncharacterized protein n=1 Tax=Trichonephila clavata TaxID=2740835 RepID=A0A8X6I3Y8_TRICU|nr:uncharacterized protein TNCT_227181 [Trichonephila clavata]
MIINVFPSLQLIAYARIAQGILYTIDLGRLKCTFLEGELGDTEFIQLIAKKISEIVLPTYCSTFSRLTAARRKPEDVLIVHLPNEVKQQLRVTVIALGLEIKQWFESHRFIVIGDNYDLRNKLSWFSFGVIDRLKTARNFIRDEDIEVGKRFHLACEYCFEDDVKMLWRNMSTHEGSDVERQLLRTRSTELWFDTLLLNIPRNWDKILLNERRNFFYGIYLGMRSVFALLRGPAMRYQCIYFALGSGVVHHYDLYSCICLLNSAELNYMLTRLPTSEFCELLTTFLQWPFQLMFIDIVNDLKRHINKDIFHDGATCILCYKLGMEFYDHVYIGIFKRFWNLFSAKYEDDFKKEGKLYTLANMYCISRKIMMQENIGI